MNAPHTNSDPRRLAAGTGDRSTVVKALWDFCAGLPPPGGDAPSATDRSVQQLLSVLADDTPITGGSTLLTQIRFQQYVGNLAGKKLPIVLAWMIAVIAASAVLVGFASGSVSAALIVGMTGIVTSLVSASVFLPLCMDAWRAGEIEGRIDSEDRLREERRRGVAPLARVMHRMWTEMPLHMGFRRDLSALGNSLSSALDSYTHGKTRGLQSEDIAAVGGWDKIPEDAFIDFPVVDRAVRAADVSLLPFWEKRTATDIAAMLGLLAFMLDQHAKKKRYRGITDFGR